MNPDGDVGEPAVRGSVADRLGHPALAPVVDKLVHRFEAGTDPVWVTLPGLPAWTRTAIADLLGLDRLPRDPLRLSVVRFARSLGLESVTQLRAELVTLRGPLGDRSADRAEWLLSRESLWDWLSEAAADLDLGSGRQRLAPWVAAQRAAGARGGVDRRRRGYEQALAVLSALPAAEAGVSLAAFADDALGDPHALDHGRAVSLAVLDAIAVALSLPRAETAEAARALWESVGVVPDALSSTVLALGLRGDDSPLGRWLTTARAAGEPVSLTLSVLRRWPVRALSPGQVCHVVENPSVLSAAVARGWSGSPLICSSGRPSVAVVTLIRQLTSDGGTAFQHADFDPAGLSITAWLTRHAGTSPWLMTAVEYLAAEHRGRPFAVDSLPETPWDPGLAEAMRDDGRPVFEEQLRERLLDSIPT